MNSRVAVLKWSGLLLGLGLAAALHGGDLAPPPGPIHPTMKTLDEVQPRVSVNRLPGDADAVHVISEPGSYCLTGDVLGEAGRHGIKITATGSVNICGSGFSLIGAPGSLDGIRMVNANPTSLASLDASGNLVDSGRLVIDGWGGDGVHTENLSGVNLAGVTVQNCTGNGVYHVMNGDGNTIKLNRCSVQGCGHEGVHIDEPISADLESLTITGCASHGVSMARLNLQHLGGDVVIHGDSEIRACGGDGLHIENLNSARIDRVHISGAGGDGISVVNTPAEVHDCASSQNGGRGYLYQKFQNGDIPTGQDFADLIDSRAIGNTAEGFYVADSAVRSAGCVSKGNGGDGFRVLRTYFQTGDKPTEAQFIESSASDNGGHGFYLADVSAQLTGGSSSNNDADGVRRDRVLDLESHLKGLGLLNMTVSGNGGNGVTTDGADFSASNVRCSDNGGSGIHCSEARIAAVLNGSVVIGNLCADPDGTLGSGAVFLNCGAVTLEGSTFENNAAVGASVGINELLPDTRLHVSRCAFDSNSGAGLDVVLGSSGAVVLENSSSSGNTGDGFRFGVGVLTPASPLGITAAGCDAHHNTGNGLSITGGSAQPGWSTGHLQDNRLAGNSGFGLYCDSGFAGGAIERNTCTGNGGGLQIGGTGNVVIQNKATAGPLGGILVSAGNDVGPVGTAAASTSPWANIAY